MAERLDSYDFQGRGRPPKYPWDEWLDGKPWRVVRGKDFPNHLDPNNFARNISSKAGRNGLRLKTHKEDENTLVFQAFPKKSKSTDS